jgi:fatty acid desaturase
VSDERLLSSEELREFTRHRPLRWLAAAALEWTIILGTIWACVATGSVVLWILGIFIIGTRQHALGILAHESVHRLVSSSRRTNDLLGNVFTSYSLTYPIEGYRVAHLRHHRLLDTPDDPERVTVDRYPEEWTFPITRSRATWILIRDLFGIHQVAVGDLIKYIWQLPRGEVLPHLVRVVAWHAVVIGVAVATGHIWAYLLLWLVPLLTVCVMCFRIRTVAEHSAIYEGEVRFVRESMDTIATTRTITGNRVMQFLFAPYNMCFHIEHHLYPSVPVFELRRLHAKLSENSHFAENGHLTSTYWALFKELTKDSTKSPTSAAA